MGVKVDSRKAKKVRLSSIDKLKRRYRCQVEKATGVGPPVEKRAEFLARTGVKRPISIRS